MIPFQNFSDGMNYLLLTNIYKTVYVDSPDNYNAAISSMNDIILCTPVMAIIINSALGVVYFVLALIIDSR